MNIKREYNVVSNLFKVEFMQLLRHPISIFWSFLFPTVLLLALSFLFSHNSGSGKYNILVSQDRYAQFAAKTIDTSKYVVLEHPEDHQIDAYLHIFAKELTLDIYNDAVTEIKTDIYNSLYRSLLNEKKDRKIKIVVQHKPKGNNGNLLKFILPGIIGVSLVSVSLFSIGTTLVSFREQSILKKFGTTPLNKWEYLLGHISGRILLILLQASWLITLGYFIVGLNPWNNFFSIICSLILGIMAFSGIGMIIGATSDKVETASAISNFVFFPMVFLSGAYFPLDSIGTVMLYVVKIVPLYHFINMFRAIYVEGKSITDFPMESLILILWFIISLIIAKFYFNWADEV